MNEIMLYDKDGNEAVLLMLNDAGKLNPEEVTKGGKVNYEYVSSMIDVKAVRKAEF